MENKENAPIKTTSGLAIASLVLSLLTFVLGPFGFIPGIIMGHLALRDIRGNPQIEGRGIAMAGLIVGYGFLAFVGVLGAVVIMMTGKEVEPLIYNLH